MFPPEGISDRDLFGGKSYDDAISYLVQGGSLTRCEENGHYRPYDWIERPWQEVNLRMIDPITFEVGGEWRAVGRGEEEEVIWFECGGDAGV